MNRNFFKTFGKLMVVVMLGTMLFLSGCSQESGNVEDQNHNATSETAQTDAFNTSAEQTDDASTGDTILVDTVLETEENPTLEIVETTEASIDPDMPPTEETKAEEDLTDGFLPKGDTEIG